MSYETPTEYFDKFPEAPEGWEHSQWCWRHWAPCPVHGGNGLLASIMVISMVLEHAPEELTNDDVGEYLEQHAAMCCELGDEVMYRIWGKCPPSGLPEAAHG